MTGPVDITMRSTNFYESNTDIKVATVSRYSRHVCFLSTNLIWKPHTFSYTAIIKIIFRMIKLNDRLEMCQYDTDAPAQGHPQPHAGILQKMKLKKGTNQSFFKKNIGRKTSFEGEKGP